MNVYTRQDIRKQGKMSAIWADPGSIPEPGFLGKSLFLATAVRELEWALTIVISYM
jgi:hypothetical protein